MGDKLTERRVRKLALPEGGVRVAYDSDVRGFGVRLSAGGARAFCLNYRHRGRERRLTIGRWPDWSVAAARKEARRLRRRIDLGEDPLEERDEERAAPTVAELWALYAREELPAKRPATQVQYRQLLRDYVLPRLGRKKAADVRRADLESMHAAMRATPIAANRALGFASALFSFAARREVRPDNPARGVRRYREQGRSRYLTPDELRRLVAALDADPNRDAADCVRLLLLTGARRAEVLCMRWGDLDLERGVWTKPPQSVKQQRTHRVPLAAPALDLLRRREPAARGPYVFPGRNPDRPRTEIERRWHAIRERAGLDDVRLHDLRHSFASFVASAGGSLPLIGALLGHSTPVTTARYSHLLDAPLREAADGVGDLFEAASADPEPEVRVDQLGQ